MDFKGFMKGPILFDRKKLVIPDCTKHILILSPPPPPPSPLQLLLLSSFLNFENENINYLT